MVSTLSPKARVYVVLIDVNGSHPNLMPDLTASLDVTLARLPGALVVPRDAIGSNGKTAFVRVKSGSSYKEQPVTVGATSALDAVVTCRRRRGRGRRPKRQPRAEPRPTASRTPRRRPDPANDRSPPRNGLRTRNSILTIAVLVLVVGGGFFATVGRGSAPDLPTAEVTRGEFVDTLELRGEIRPLKSIVLSSPMQSGELQILKLATNGTKVKAGDVVVQFDGTTLQRTIQEKQSELKQANAEIEQANAQARIANEQNATALMKAKYDIERAKLDINKGDTVSRIENEQAKLALGDAEQRLEELEVKMRSDRTGAEADLSSKLRKREKALFDLKRAEDGLEKLQLKAPTRRRRQRAAELPFRQHDGRRARVPPGRPRLGRRRDPRAARPVVGAPPGAARRIRSQPPQGGAGRRRSASRRCPARTSRPGSTASRCWRASTIRAPGRRRATSISTSCCIDVDPRIRPGMTAVARIATERVPDVVLVPSEAIFQRDGATVVYQLDGSEFDERRVADYEARQGTGDRRVGRRARRSHRDPASRRPK